MKTAIVNSSDLTREKRWDAPFHIALKEYGERIAELESEMNPEEATARAMKVALSRSTSELLPLKILLRGQADRPGRPEYDKAIREYPYLSIALFEAADPDLAAIRKMKARLGDHAKKIAGRMSAHQAAGIVTSLGLTPEIEKALRPIFVSAAIRNPSESPEHVEKAIFDNAFLALAAIHEASADITDGIDRRLTDLQKARDTLIDAVLDRPRPAEKLPPKDEGFQLGWAYPLIDAEIYDDEFGEGYDMAYVPKSHTGIGPDMYVVDCWIVNEAGEIHPGRSDCPVPVRRQDLHMKAGRPMEINEPNVDNAPRWG